jgi:hypothetical protein
MKGVIIIIITLFNLTLSYSQSICKIDDISFTPTTKPLFTYPFPSDTTSALLTYTYISITSDSLYYADVLKYKSDCNNLLIIKTALNDLKNDVGYQIQEIILNDKIPLKGYLLTVYTSIGHNVFDTFQMSSQYGSSSVKGNMLNIICANFSDAETLREEIDKLVKAK